MDNVHAKIVNKSCIESLDRTPMTSVLQVTKTSPIILKWLYENFEFADGSSVSRSTIYYLYLQQCTSYNLEPLNSASFGKLIRSIFVNIKTRRLGTRGNSKYHYYGLKIKPQSSLNDINKQYIDNLQNMFGQKCYQLMLSKCDDQLQLKEDHSFTTPFQSPPIFKNNTTLIQHEKLNTNDCPIVMGNNNMASNAIFCDLDLVTACHLQQFLGNLGPLTLPNFDSALVDRGSIYNNMPLDILANFLVVYKKHVESLIKAVLKLQFSEVELLWKSFWDFRSNNLNNVLNPSSMKDIASYNPLIKYIEMVDTILYDYLTKLLIKDILEPIPCQLTQAIRSFAKHMVVWIIECVKNVPKNMAHVKIVTVNAFSQTLKRFTSLNHLAQAARNVLQNQDQISQMLTDLDRLDILTLKQQALWLTDCQHELIDQIYNQFRANLKTRLSLEEWAIWCQDVLHLAVKQSITDNNTIFAKKAKLFLLHWSFYGSAFIKDLTLKSAPSFGSFHILRLLFEEYMSYLVEEKVAKRTGQTLLSMLVQSMEISTPQNSIQNNSHNLVIDIDKNLQKLEEAKEDIYYNKQQSPRLAYPKTNNDVIRIRGLALNHVPPSISPSEMITKTHENGNKVRPSRPLPIKYIGGPSASLYDTSVLGDFGGGKRKQQYEDTTLMSGSQLKTVEVIKQQQQNEDQGDPVMKLWPLDKFDTEKLFNDTAFEYIDLITSYNLNMPHKVSKAATTDYGHFNDDSQINYDSLIFDR